MICTIPPNNTIDYNIDPQRPSIYLNHNVQFIFGFVIARYRTLVSEIIQLLKLIRKLILQNNPGKHVHGQ